MSEFICPRCGKKSMMKKEAEPGKYILVCSLCGFTRGVLPTRDTKRGVV
jgi:transcription elongation factor Elf1